MYLFFSTSDLALQCLESLKPIILPLLQDEEYIQNSIVVFDNIKVKAQIIPRRCRYEDDLVKVYPSSIFKAFAKRCVCPKIQHTFSLLQKQYDQEWMIMNFSDTLSN